MLNVESIVQFQFHKGTIKTSVANSLLAFLPHFNSIKVRLKHID